MVKSYQKGYKFELEVKHTLESQDYCVIRSAGSHSPCDLVALKNGTVYQVQCKNMSTKITSREKYEIEEWANRSGFPVLILYRTERTSEIVHPKNRKVIPKGEEHHEHHDE